jgi:DNA-binding CsgD family transcriptional regulator
VRTHMQHVLAKLDVHTTLEAVTQVLREQSPGRWSPPPKAWN